MAAPATLENYTSLTDVTRAADWGWVVETIFDILCLLMYGDMRGGFPHTAER
jgi:hypothetical protein